MKSLSLLIVLSLLSCQSFRENKSENGSKIIEVMDSLTLLNKSDTLIYLKKTPNSIFDSIKEKLQLSTDQIRYYTSIDSIYYTGMFSDVVFQGDTLINLAMGYKGAIIEYDDRRSCIYKFLFVLKPSGNEKSAYKIIFTDCDHDESAGYKTLNYVIINDSTFETAETFIPAMGKTSKIQKHNWKIRNNEIIEEKIY